MSAPTMEEEEIYGQTGEDSLSTNPLSILEPWISEIAICKSVLDNAISQAEFIPATLEPWRYRLDSTKDNIVGLKRVLPRYYTSLLNDLINKIRAACRELNLAIGELEKKDRTRKYYHCLGNTVIQLEKAIDIFYEQYEE